MILRWKYSIRSLLILISVFSIATWVACIPARNAKKIATRLANGKLIGPHDYMEDQVLVELNSQIPSASSHLPPFSNSYVSTIATPSITDLLLLRQPMQIEFVTYPIPPAYQGPITRHRVEYVVGLKTVRERTRTQKVLYEYYE